MCSNARAPPKSVGVRGRSPRWTLNRVCRQRASLEGATGIRVAGPTWTSTLWQPADYGSREGVLTAERDGRLYVPRAVRGDGLFLLLVGTHLNALFHIMTELIAALDTSYMQVVWWDPSQGPQYDLRFDKGRQKLSALIRTSRVASSLWSLPHYTWMPFDARDKRCPDLPVDHPHPRLDLAALATQDAILAHLADCYSALTGPGPHALIAQAGSLVWRARRVRALCPGFSQVRVHHHHVYPQPSGLKRLRLASVADLTFVPRSCCDPGPCALWPLVASWLTKDPLARARASGLLHGCPAA